MRFKAVCTDIDGTLLNTERQLSARTINAFRKLPKDVVVILASSRMPSAMRHLQEELGVLHQPLICFNGGYVIHYTNGSQHPEEVDSVAIPVDTCQEIVGLAKGTQIHVSLYHRDDWFVPAWDYWAERESTITKVKPQVVQLESLIEVWKMNKLDGHKVMCMGPKEEIDQMEAELQKKFNTSIHIYRSRPTYLELAAKSISKGSALQLLLEKKFSISMEEVVSFGDNYNDVELLAMSGYGVAVKNSREEVKAVAAEITEDSKLDGVAVTLERIFNLPTGQEKVL